MEGVPFHVFGMKDTDYVMSLMSTYGTLNDMNCRESARDYKEGQEKRRKVFRYTEVINNHYKFRHSVDDHNGLRHFPISFEESWATKFWPNRVFAFLLAITEVNVKLAAAHFYGETFASMIKFRQQFAKELLDNNYLETETINRLHRSPRNEGVLEHFLMRLPKRTKFEGSMIVPSNGDYNQFHCRGCSHRRVRTYCKCSPGIVRCEQCFAMHLLESEMK